MRTERAGVAISTTGDEHRMGFLETCVQHWERALSPGDSMFVTVDGDEAAAARVADVVYDYTGSVYRVGQKPLHASEPYPERMGVAVNKNTGLELLMDAGIEHLFLSDDDTWPLYQHSLLKHMLLGDMGVPHSMVCWGKSRLINLEQHIARWSWPRGVLLYQRRLVVEMIGGMDERFGPGGHEHVEWSQRIHNAGLTPAPFLTPASYAQAGPSGKAMRASVLWHCEDMRRPDETLAQHAKRKEALTSIRRTTADWEKINAVMASREGDTAFVPFRAHENGRASATLCENKPCAVEPETPRSEK